MRRLMLLRHAMSDRPTGIADHERPLAARGQRDSLATGRYLAAEGLIPDLAIVSTARRTQQTWEILRTTLAKDVVQHDERRIYEASTASILGVINATDPGIQTLLLVGHNPGLHDLALKLIGSAAQPDLARLQLGFPTSGLVVIYFDAENWRQATKSLGHLERFEHPKRLD